MTGLSGSFASIQATRAYMYWWEKTWRTDWLFCGWHPNGCGKIRLRWRGK